MKDIVNKLITHLKWRLSPAGRKFKPKRVEIESWAPKRIPPSVPVLVWLAFIFVCLFGAIEGADPFASPASFFILGPGGWVISGILLRQINRAINRSFVIGAYKKLLKSHERFTLVEYTRYLERQIRRAKEDPALGGSAEVQRLLGVYGDMMQLLREGSGEGGEGPIDSSLTEDAELAEALVQSYGELKVDPLHELDERLPEELLARIMNLEREEKATQTDRQVELD